MSLNNAEYFARIGTVIFETKNFDVAPSPRAVVDLVGRRYLSANKNLFLFKNKNM